MRLQMFLSEIGASTLLISFYSFIFYILWWSQKWLLVDNLVGVYDEVTFPTNMREKGTEVALANGSLMIKSVEFSVFLRE